jgi:hypothetical protein
MSVEENAIFCIIENNWKNFVKIGDKEIFLGYSYNIRAF